MSASGSRSARAMLPQLARLMGRGSLTGFPEAQLLEEFITRNDEAAFEAIVTRHGPMVLRVCRQLLRDPNDVDDAFQATFIVLARRAASLKRRDLLGNWLHGVACRVAKQSRFLAARREAKISQITPVEALGNPETTSAGLEPDTFLRLHEAIRHLPDRYRIPIVLCYLEGLTHEEAAERLGWPLGSVKGRLARARDLLRKRLVRRGVGLSAATAITNLDQPARAVVVPHLIKVKALRSALALSGESARAFAATSAISVTVATLTQGVIRTMVVSQIRAIVIPAVIGIGIVSAGTSVVAFQSGRGARESEKSEPNPAGDVAPQRPQSKPETAQTGSNQPAQSKPQSSNPGTGSASGSQKPKGASFSPPPQSAMVGGRGRADDDLLGGPQRPQGVARRQRIESLHRQLNAELASAIAEADKNPKTQEILKKLDEPIAMSFGNETPIEDVLKYIQAATADKAKRYAGIPIYVDPQGLQEAEKTLQSPVSITLEGSSLKTTLRLILKQLDLAYCVHDGFLMISTPRGIREELEECRAELGVVKPENPQLEQELQMLENGQSGFGGIGGGGMR